MYDLPGLRDSAESNEGRRNLLVDLDTVQLLASTNHWELQTLLNNWFQTKEHNEPVQSFL